MDRHRRKRATLRAGVTKTISDSNALLDTQSTTTGELQDILNVLIMKEAALRDIDKQIEDLVDDENLELVLEAAEAYYVSICVAKSKLSRRIEENQRPQTANAPMTNLGSPSAPRADSSATIKLPRLEIEKFDGKIQGWRSFWDQYEATIHRNPQLSSIDKFKYLKGYLVGKAQDTISGLSLTESNYQIAIDLLEERFGRKDLAINDHMTRLLQLRAVPSAQDVESLRRLYDEVVKHVRSLEALGVKQEQYSALLRVAIEKRLPHELVLRYCQQKPEEAGASNTFSALLNFLKKEVRSREEAIEITSDGLTRQKKPHDATQRQHLPSAATLTTASGTDKERCFFCNSEDHAFTGCDRPFTLEQKKDLLKRSGRCFKCCKKFHRAKDCRNAKFLRCQKCQGRHYAFLCDSEDTDPSANNTKKALITKGVQVTSTVTPAADTILLQTAKVWARGSTQPRLIRCLLDGGSQRTFVTEDVVKSLHCKVVGKESLNLQTFGEVSSSNKTLRRVELRITSRHNNEDILVEALEVPTICSGTPFAVPAFCVGDDVDDLRLADDAGVPTESNIGVLIGADYYWKVATGKIRRLENGLTAVETSFGWTLQGPVKSTEDIRGTFSTGVMKVLVQNFSDDTEKLSQQLQAFWEVEHMGILDHESEEPTEHPVFTEFKRTIRKKDGRYEVCLPWKDNAPELDCNLKEAKDRLAKLTRRLQKNKELLVRYDVAIREYVEKDFAEPVTTQDAAGPIYYLPHRAVIRNDRETTKTRIVFDASSSSPGKLSLNDVLHPGPNLNPSVLSLLLKFRMYRVAVTADIEKAFLQILLSEKDRDALRYFWYDCPPAPGQTLPKQLVWRMNRVPFGATSSPFLLSATLQYHFETSTGPHEKLTKAMKNQFYVDDFVTGCDTTENALLLCDNASAVIGKAGMHLRKWTTNDPQLKAAAECDDTVHSDVQFTIPQVKKVLGVIWHPQEDTYGFDTSEIMQLVASMDSTKRNMLKITAQIYDPYGLITPYTVKAKILFQSAWKRKLDWDEGLSEELKDEWEKWCEDLRLLNVIRVPRFVLLSKELNKTTFHVFSDASTSAYGSAVYVRVETASEITTRLIIAKTRVAPVKTLSLPRLELLGALTAARLMSTVRKELDTHYQIWFWTDSSAVLGWLNSNPLKWKTFVANRVSEIHALTDVEQWRYCPTEYNPADLVTRGISGKKLQESKLWWEGPDWLLKEKDEWPNRTFGCSEQHAETEEERTRVLPVTNLKGSDLFDLARINNTTKVLNITAWIMRFVHNCRNPDRKLTGPLLTCETENAEKFWISKAQERSFYPLYLTHPAISKFSPYRDEGNLIRVGGRLQNSDFTTSEQHPIVLPPDDEFTRLIIENEHRRLLHAGIRDTLMQLRERYWIIRGRQMVKKVINRCCMCKRFAVKPMSEPFAPLPRDRVTKCEPFSVIGVDFTGPLYHRDGNRTKKCYIVIFTCAVVRAVHLELVRSLNTPDFLDSFRRFTARRGICKTVYSDNSLTFKRASKDLKTIWSTIRDEKLLKYLREHRIHWKFNAERAAWWGGFWERLIRTIKESLRKVLKANCFCYDELYTILIEVEAIVNSRPLTTLSETLEEEPLTPAHFLIGRRLLSVPEGRILEIQKKSSDEEFQGRWRRRQVLLDAFWNRWHREYILQLPSAHTVNNVPTSGAKVGDIVLIVNDKAPRSLWEMAIIEKTFPGSDNRVRLCLLRKSDGSHVRRAVQHLYRLEAAS